MSPRRRFEPGQPDSFRLPDPQPQRRSLAVAATVGAVLVATALTASAVIFVNQQAQHRSMIREAAVLTFVKSFLTQYTSPDPFHANDYADRVLELGTGNFAKLYSESMNDVVIQVARSEPGVGSVQEIGIERWNSDSSANVIAVADMTTKMPDGKKVQTQTRWEVTAVKEGEQWKVSDLIQVI
ncbi:MAG: mammalian cell entry protein [Mycobacterium sp.]